jgi:hypothetical protein
MRINRLFVAATAALLCVASAAIALVVPQQYSPRYFGSQQTHYLRFEVNFNDCSPVLITGTVYTCVTKRGALPYNAFLIRAYTQTITAFNSTTADDILLVTGGGGTTAAAPPGVCGTALTLVAAGGGILCGAAGGTTGSILAAYPAASGNHGYTAAQGMQSLTFYTLASGLSATGGGDTPTGSNGGFDVYSQYASLGGLSTAGAAVFILEYIAPNDGSCVTPPLGSTSIAC